MKKNDRSCPRKTLQKRRVLAGMEIAVVVLMLASGVSHFIESREWSWICWVVIVLCLELRLWLLQDALRRKEDESETWRVLYQKQCNMNLDLAWENENLRKDRGEDAE